MTIPLKNAMFAWNDRTKRVKIIKHPAYPGQFKDEGMDSDVGAAFTIWSSYSKEKRLNVFYKKAYELCALKSFDAKHIHDELMVIPEYSELYS